MRMRKFWVGVIDQSNFRTISILSSPKIIRLENHLESNKAVNERLPTSERKNNGDNSEDCWQILQFLYVRERFSADLNQFCGGKTSIWPSDSPSRFPSRNVLTVTFVLPQRKQYTRRCSLFPHGIANFFIIPTFNWTGHRSPPVEVEEAGVSDAAIVSAFPWGQHQLDCDSRPSYLRRSPGPKLGRADLTASFGLTRAIIPGTKIFLVRIGLDAWY